VKLEGTTDLFAVRELIEMVTYSTVTGALNIYSDSSSGSIYFRDGRMVHISYGALSGLDALTELFIQQSAYFTFVSDVRCEEETVWGDAHFLINSAELMAERWHTIRQHVPSLDLVPQLIAANVHAQLHLLPAQQILLQAIDGRSDLRELSKQLSWSPIDVCEVVVELMQVGILQLGRKGGGSGPGPDQRSAAQQRGRPGLFERIATRVDSSALGTDIGYTLKPLS
jgi:Domain of unknown function (DUF4388)